MTEIELKCNAGYTHFKKCTKKRSQEHERIVKTLEKELGKITV